MAPALAPLQRSPGCAMTGNAEIEIAPLDLASLA